MRPRFHFVVGRRLLCSAPRKMPGESALHSYPTAALMQSPPTLEPQGIHKLWVKGKDSGSPQVSTKVFEPGNTLGAGLWECTPGSWSITRDTTETFLVLQGKALLTEADGSLRVELRPGVWHTTPSGWTGSWSVEETVRKMFVLSP